MKELLKNIGLFLAVIFVCLLIAMMIGNLADNDNIVGYVFSFIDNHLALSIILIVIIVWVIKGIIDSRKE